MNWTEFLRNEIESAFTTTSNLIEKVDESQLDWKPQTGTNWLTVGQLLKHITEACGYGCKAFVTGDWSLPDGRRMEDLPPEQMLPSAEKFPAVQSIDEARRLLSDDIALALCMLDLAEEDRLCHSTVGAPWDPGARRSLGYQLFRMVQHLNQHKSQLFYYLKLQGKSVNTADLWG